MAPGCVRWASSAAARARPKSRILTVRRAFLRPGLQPDVGRLDVAVDQPALVGRRQPLRHLPADAQHLGHRQLALPLEPFVERLAFEELHRQEGDAAILADLVDGDDVVVLRAPRPPAPRAGNAGVPLSLAARAGSIALRATRRCELGILGPEDDAHAAGAQHLQDAVGAQPAQLVRSLGRGQEIIGYLRGRVVRGSRDAGHHTAYRGRECGFRACGTGGRAGHPHGLLAVGTLSLLAG